jgi:hypothetical protein
MRCGRALHMHSWGMALGLRPALAWATGPMPPRVRCHGGICDVAADKIRVRTNQTTNAVGTAPPVLSRQPLLLSTASRSAGGGTRQYSAFVVLSDIVLNTKQKLAVRLDSVRGPLS